MNDYYNAFEMSPVPDPGEGVEAPEVYRGIYAMPMFVTIPTSDLQASSDFWTRGPGFIEIFSFPGQLVHLRRWAFQDVLLVASDSVAGQAPAISTSFACVLDQIDPIAAACEELLPGCTSGPRGTPWNTFDVEVITPEKARVIFTAAKPFDPDSAEARSLNEAGIFHPAQ